MSYRRDLSLLKRGSIRWNAWREENPEVRPDLSGIDRSGEDHSRFNFSLSNLNSASFNKADLNEADFCGADLSEASFCGADLNGANLSQADLSGADFSGANLKGANLQGSDFNGVNFSRANLNGVILSGANLSGSDFTEADLKGADLSNSNLGRTILKRANLTEANLSGASLIKSDLNQANLSGAKLHRADLSRANLERANLRKANFSRTQALGANFTEADLTGACIEDWNINGETQFCNTNCQYIYLKSGQQERRPHSGEFKSGEFTLLIQESIETVDLIFADGINWKAFFQAFKELQEQYEGDQLSIKAIEKKNHEAFIIRLEVPVGADKESIESKAKELYKNDLAILEAQYRTELKVKDAELAIYRKQSTDLIEIIKLQASRPINVEAKAVAESQSSSDTFNNDFQGANISNFANQVKDNARLQANQYNYASPEKQSLAEAAAEIQRLLKQLEQTNPSATEAEQITYVNVAAKPDLKQRAIAALKAGGDTAIDEFFLENKYLKVGKAVVKAWIQPSG